MHSKAILSAALVAAAGVNAADNERTLGVYLIHRHGDRTAKAWPPNKLTALGADEVFQSGSYYRDLYVDQTSSKAIAALSEDLAVFSQLSIRSPVGAVLHNSAVTFLQALYPPSGEPELLANGSKVEGPLNGYQYIPINTQDAATISNPEKTAWLQGTSGCSKAISSSNGYFQSADYKKTYDDSLSFYQSLLPLIEGTYSKDAANFKNGYSIFDLINVARVHNATFPSDKLSDADFQRLFNLASVHEWNLAYNASEPIRAVAGSIIAGQVVDALGAIVDAKPTAPVFNAQFAAYGTFMSFFGLADLPQVSSDFYGVCNYASSMAFELFTTAKDASADNINVRFLFANGTADADLLKPFPLFGQKETTLSWNDFKNGMNKFAIAGNKEWCGACGNNQGMCASNATTNGDTATAAAGDDNGISKPVAGVIGACVTIAAVVIVLGAVVGLGGMRMVKKSTLQANRAAKAPVDA